MALEIGFYVTVYDAGKHGFLLGPFGTKKEAENNVDLGRKLAEAHDSWACFYAFGTARVKERIERAKPPVFDGHSCSRCPGGE